MIPGEREEFLRGPCVTPLGKEKVSLAVESCAINVKPVQYYDAGIL